jgi:DNA recombination protein RmuC
MNSPGPRGKWGEMRVRQILEAAGFKEDVHFIHNKKSELGADRPDFVINGADGKKIILDAKVPFTAFEESTKTEDLNEVKRLHKKHATETRGHMDKLAKSSYWNQYEDAAPFVLMVLPAEALLYAAFQADDSLFKDGIDKQIYICSPLNLLATMQVIAQGHVHVKQNEDARKITTAARDLLKVISIFNGHFKAIGMHTERLFKSFNKGAKTLEVKVKPKLEKLSDMGIELEKGKEVDPGIKMIEDGPINIFEDEDIELSENSE